MWISTVIKCTLNDEVTIALQVKDPLNYLGMDFNLLSVSYAQQKRT